MFETIAETSPTLIVISIVLFAGVLGLALFAGPFFRRWLGRREQRYARSLYNLFLFTVSPRSIVRAMLASAASVGAFGWLASGSFIGGIVGAVIGSFVPAIILKYLAYRRRTRLESQLVDGILALSNSVRAGLTLVDALRLVEENAPLPLSQEFALILREYEHGVALEQALDNAANRIPNPSYKLVFAALKTSRERGGDVGITLDRIRDSVREIHRLEERVKTLTAQGRLAARIMMVMPLFIALILFMIDPSGITLLFTDPVGHILLLIIVVFIILGSLWIRKIVNVDI